MAPSFSANQVPGGYIVTARVARPGQRGHVRLGQHGPDRGQPRLARPVAIGWPLKTGRWCARGRPPVTALWWAEALSDHVVGMAATPDGRGYWLVTSGGSGLRVRRRASTTVSVPGSHPAAPMVGMAATPDGRGYWLAASNGAVYAFGDAHYYGSEPASKLSSAIVGIAGSAERQGLLAGAKNGGVFAFGQATSHGSTRTLHLSAPVVGIAAVPGGKGYWLVAKDGGVFSFGGPPSTAQRTGSLPAPSSP